MVICTTKDKKLQDIINNYYIYTKEELDKYISKTYANLVISIEDDFIADQFVGNGINIIDYVAMIKYVKPFISFLYNNATVDNVDTLIDKMNFINSPRTFALHVLNNPKLLDTIKYHINNIGNKELEVNISKAKLAYTLKQLEDIKLENEALEESNKALTENNMLLKSRLELAREHECKINTERYNICIYFKINDDVQYTYTLLAFFRNMLTERNITSSVLVMLPPNTDVLYYKWKRRGFVDLRTPLVNKLLNTNRAVADELSQSNIDIYTNNTVGSKVLIILDKSLTGTNYAVGENIKAVDIGNNLMKGYTHLGEPPVIENYNNKDIFKFGKIYSENVILSSLLSEVTKYV